MRKGRRWMGGLLAVGLLILWGCAFNLVTLKEVPVGKTAVVDGKSSWRLAKDISVAPASGQKVKLKSGTEWQYVCTIDQGDVYKTKDQVVAITASNTYEAYIVITDAGMTGFFLPLEKTFSPLHKLTPLAKESK